MKNTVTFCCSCLFNCLLSLVKKGNIKVISPNVVVKIHYFCYQVNTSCTCDEKRFQQLFKNCHVLR